MGGGDPSESSAPIRQREGLGARGAWRPWGLNRVVDAALWIAEHPRSLSLTLLIAAVLVAPALMADFVADDLFHQHMATGAVAELQRAPTDYYRFFLDDESWHLAARESGFLPWFTEHGFHGEFLRPLASLSLYVDHQLAPGSPFFAHAHSIAWYLALIVATSLVYRRLMGSGALAGLALLIFAIDDAHAVPVGWVANRNALMAMSFASTAFWLHIRWRQERRLFDGVATLPVLLTGLLCSEVALSITAFHFSYAVFLEQGRARDRVLGLLPAAGLCLAWLAVYKWLGYGMSGSELYVEPSGDPSRFLTAVVLRLPVLLAGAVTPLSADFSMAMTPDVLWRLSASSALVVGLFGFALWPWLRTDRGAAFWLVGAAISMLPVCAAFPGDRLLLAPSLGAAALALFLKWLLVTEGPSSERIPPRTRAAAWLIVLTHLVVSPLTLPARVFAPHLIGNTYLQGGDTLDGFEEEFDSRTLVLVSTVDLFFGSFAVFNRVDEGGALPARVRTLHSGTSGCVVERPDEHTLLIRARAEFSPRLFDRLLRSPSPGWRVGETEVRSDSTFEVIELGTRGWPSVVRFEFVRPLEDREFVWVVWTEDGYQRFELPEVGGAVEVPEVSPFGATTFRMFESRGDVGAPE